LDLSIYLLVECVLGLLKGLDDSFIVVGVVRVNRDCSV
jgi:hypothetical protein